MKEFILFDCDTGADDAIALMMLLGQTSKVKTVGVTCVGGNTPLHNVTMNNLRVLKLFDQLDKIPLFQGCPKPLLPFYNLESAPSEIHGTDGFGGKPDFYPPASPDLLQYVQQEHAVNAIIRLSKEYKGKLKIVATGPLTNLAMALNLDPKLPSRLSNLYVMGGTRYGKGNITPAAEFNFRFDPEAACITLHGFSKNCPVHLLDFEFTQENSLTWSKYDDWLASAGNIEKGLFAKMVLHPLETFSKQKRLRELGIGICDTYAMAIAIDSSIGLKPESKKVCVELGGFHSRGHLVLDYFNHNCKDFATVTIYHEWDNKKYETLLEQALS